MRITRSSGRIIIRDRPGPSWGLGLFLLTGGVVATAMPLGLATNAADLQPWLSELWSHDRLGIAEAATVMSRACDLPSPPRPEILATRGRQDG